MRKRTFKERLFRALGELRGRRYYSAQRFDGARHNPADRGTWAHVDLLAYDVANDKATRERIRARARYVVANNAYAAGAAQALVNACVGTRPRIQLYTDDLDAAAVSMIEADFMEWAGAVNLPSKLRAGRFARFVDGEAFFVLYNNPRLKTASGVQLDLKALDADRVTSDYFATSSQDVDGVILDEYGNAVKYRILDHHPGDVSGVDARNGSKIYKATIYDASRVCHWFNQMYPEQHRGTSELAPALELFALIDRYSKAVVQASETAADIAMVFTTDSVSDDGAYSIDETPQAVAGDGPPFAQIPWSRGMTMTAPEGWSVKQVNAEQPSSSYSMLVNEVLAQIGASIGVPKLLMKNSAENYNYSSARVDLQQFQIKTRLDRQTLAASVLNPIFREWFKEYRAIAGVDARIRCEWFFDGFFHVDPLKEANASRVRLDSLTSTYSDEIGARGLDWEQQLHELAREKALIKDLEKRYGVTLTPGAQTPDIKEDNDD